MHLAYALGSHSPHITLLCSHTTLKRAQVDIAEVAR